MKKSDAVFLIFSGISLCVAWWPDIIPTILNGTSLKLIENYTTESTYVLDLGIISPLCFISLILMKKKDSFGVVLYAILLQSIIVVAVMMITQSALQFASGVEIPLPALISKSIIFVILGLFAIALDRRRINQNENKEI
jgi:4-amino-4-deoxy-L-arabinose transferase-like glycosyltransferase